MPNDITDIAHVIQLSVAPVFLLSGIAALLNVLNSRLSRIIDRARLLEAEFPGASPQRVATLRVSLRRLALRARLISGGISLCTSSAILISSVVIALFIAGSRGANVGLFITILFITAMILLTLGLVMFLREIYISTRYLRIGEPEPEQSAAAEIVTTQHPPPA
jgi:hypothetical protein